MHLDSWLSLGWLCGVWVLICVCYFRELGWALSAVLTADGGDVGWALFWVLCKS